MLNPYILLIVMTIIGAFGAYFFKKSTLHSTGLTGLLLEKSFYIGVGLYVASAVLNIYILKYLPYTVVLPLTSITYVWTMLISYILLKEKITRYKKAGILLVFLGALLIGLS